MLQELYRREQNEKIALAELFAYFLGIGAGINTEIIKEGLDLYIKEVTQARYRPSMIKKAREARQTVARTQKKTEQLLQSLDRYTVPEVDAPSSSAKEGGRRRR